MNPTNVSLKIEPEIIIPEKITVVVTMDDGKLYTPTGYRLLDEEIPTSYGMGIAVAGLEFAENTLPGTEGTNYKSNGLAEYERLSKDGFSLFRIPFIAERFDANYTKLIEDNVNYARSLGSKVWLDFHNYGRSLDTAKRVELAKKYLNDDTVECIEIDNEPHDLDQANYYSWVISCVEAIQSTGWSKKIAIPMFNWSSMDDFADSKKEFEPPIKGDNIYYVFHNYFNKGNTGYNHPALPDEPAKLHADRLQYCIDWADRHGVKLAITEFGVPPTQAWVDNATLFIDLAKGNNIPLFYWAGGEWYNSETVYKQVHKSII